MKEIEINRRDFLKTSTVVSVGIASSGSKTFRKNINILKSSMSSRLKPRAVKLSEYKLNIMEKGGAWIPSPLALDKNHKVLEDWQRLLTLYYIRSGARTIIPGAHTGEFAGNDLNIYDRWLKLVKEMILEYGGKDMFLMSAVGGKNVFKQAEISAKNGFDIVMVAPTAFTNADDNGAAKIFYDIASIIPAFGFELQKVIPGSRAYSFNLWLKIFDVAYGAKGASFNTYRAQLMLNAAAHSKRRDKLVFATGNDDRIVSDLGGKFPFFINGHKVTMKYSAGLLGHFATDTYSAVRWAQQVLDAKNDAVWRLDITEKELAHLVNMCNGALFDAYNDFKNSVWGVKTRLMQLGLLPYPYCFNESGRKGLSEEIAAAYKTHPALNDSKHLKENLNKMKKEIGIKI